MRPSAPTDLAARAPVWSAISELFLDTDLFHVSEMRQSPPCIEFVARALAASPYTVDELREIELWEVAPVAMPAPFDLAPEWAGFAPEYLEKHCARRAARRSWVLRQRVRFGFGDHVREFTERCWDYLGPRITELRAEAAP